MCVCVCSHVVTTHAGLASRHVSLVPFDAMATCPRSNQWKNTLPSWNVIDCVNTGGPGRLKRRNAKHLNGRGATGHMNRKGSRGHVKRKGSRGRVKRRGSRGHVKRKGSIGRVKRRGSTGHVNRKGSIGHVDRKGSIGHVNRKGSIGHVNRGAISHRVLLLRRYSACHPVCYRQKCNWISLKAVS